MDANYEPQEETVEVAGFIAKTFEILNVQCFFIQNQDFSRVVYWSPSGAEFIIKDINKFQQVVLPKYFRHNKINSFIRQLNMYGFHKSRKEHSKSVFSHPLFQKNREDLLCEIKRKIKLNEEEGAEKCETPVKPQKILKEELETAMTTKNSVESKETIITSLKQLNSLENMGSSFIKLFESKENFMSKQQFNFSLNRISANCIGEANSDLEDMRDDDVISIEAGIEEKQ